MLATTRQIIAMLATTKRIIAVLVRLALVLLGSVAYLLVAGVAPASAHQPHDPMFTVAVSPNYANDHTIFVGTGLLSVTLATSLLLKSTDGGSTFQVSPGLPNYPITAVSLSPGYAGDETVFAGTQGGGLWKSGTGGSSWTYTGVGGSIVALALSPDYSADQTLFTSNGQGGLYKSTDGGTTWQHLVGLTAPAEAIAVSASYATDQKVFVGSPNQGIFMSADGGTTWTPMSQGLGANASISALATSPIFDTSTMQAHAVVGGPASPSRSLARHAHSRPTASNRRMHNTTSLDQTLVAGTTNAGVYVSIDGGATWSASNTGLTDSYITALVFSPSYASDQTVYVSTASGRAFKSTNGTASWTATARVPRNLTPQTSVHARAMAISPNYAADNTVFMAMFEGLNKTTNAGSSWQYEETLPPWLVRGMSISPTYSADHTVIASNYGGGMVQTTDGGSTWRTQANNINLVDCYPNATALSAPYSGGSASFAGTVYGLQKLGPTATSWAMLDMLGVSVSLRATAVSPNFANDQTVYMGTDYLETPDPITTTYQGQVISTDGAFVSFDGGKDWAPTGINGMPVHSLAVSPNFASDGTVFASSLNQGLYKSTDRGTTFAAVPGPLSTAAVDPVAISPGYATDHTVFAVVPTGPAAQRGLYRSTDGGTTWSLLPASQGFTIVSLAVSPNYAVDHTLFVGTLERSLLMSTDGGNSYAGTGLNDAYVTAVVVSPAYASDRTLYAAAYQGIWESNDGAATWRPMPIKATFSTLEPSIIRIGKWQKMTEPGADCTDVYGSSTMSDTIQFAFSGTGITWTGGKGIGYGTANVYLDGVWQQTVDLYAPSYAPQQTLYQNQALARGNHTLQIVVTGQHDPQARGSLVTVDDLVVTRSLP